MPVLVLTAQDAVDFKVQALKMGADDYVTKPFSLEKLLAGWRRSATPEGDRAAGGQGGDLTLDTGSREIRPRRKVIELTPKEYAVLEYSCATTARHVADLITEYAWTTTSTRHKIVDVVDHAAAQEDRPRAANPS